MKNNYPKVSIITVNFNGKKYLKKLFDSIFRLNYPKNKLEVIFVDNVSTDNSVEFVKKNYPKVKIIKNDVNSYCKAVNLGIVASKAKYVALVNNDTRLDKNWLMGLIKVIARDKKIAAVGSKMLNMAGKIQNVAHYELPNFYWGERGAGKERKRYNTIEEVSSLSGTAVLYRKDTLLEVGLFDEDFVIYGEDVDISLRLRQKGYKLVYVPTSIAYHKFHGTASEEFARYYIERNRLLFLVKHYPHKLSSSLLGSGYFTAERSVDSAGKIYSIFPEIITKLIKTHSLDITNEVISELFGEINKIINYENEILTKEINKITNDRNNTYTHLNNILKELQQESDKANKKDSELTLLKDKFAYLSEQYKIQTEEISQKTKIISDKEKELSYFKVELERIKEQIRSRIDEILVKDGQLIERDSRITNLDNQLNQLNQEIQEHLNDLQAKKALLAQREEELTNLRDELNNLSQQLRQRMDEVLFKDGQLIERDSRITNLDNQLNQLNQEIQQHLDDLQAKGALLLQREEELTNLKNELNNLSQQLRQRMDEVLLKDGQLIEKDSRITNLDNQLNQLNQEIQQHLDDLQAKKALLAQREEELTHLRDELNNLSQQLRQRMDEVLLKDGQLIEKDSQINSLNTQITQLDQQLQEHLNNLQVKEGLLSERERELICLKDELNNLSQQLRQRMDEVLLKDGQLIERDTQLTNLRDELTNLSNQLRQRMDEVLLKDGQLIERDTQLANLREELNNLSRQLRQRMDEVLVKDGEIIQLKDELSGIYNSEGFRFVLRPLWTTIWYARIFFKTVRRKLTQIFWFIITIVLTPVFLFLSLCFLLEYVNWFMLSPLLKRIATKRKIKSIKDGKISLVMPNYNGIGCLRECLPSIFAAEGFTDGQNEVLVVDDGSTDGSVKFIQAHFSGVRLIQNRRNRGFGFTCNRGVKAAKNEIIVLINNDIILTKDFLKPLISHLQKEDVFVATPKLYGWDRKTFVWGMHMGRFEEGYIKLWNEAQTGNGDKINQTSPSIFAIGGAMVFRKSDFLWLGGFDSIYRPNCWEDIDLSYRAWKRGLKVLYEPKGLMYHKARATLTYERPKEIKNELLFTWKNITDAEILKNHLNLLPWNLYRNRMNFLKGFFWALNYLPQMLLHRFLDRRYIRTQDKKIFNQCMLYYRNFMRRGFRHLQDNEKKQVLIITPFMLYPLNSGGKIRIHTLAKLLKSRFDISLLTLIDREDEVNYIPELKKTFKEVYAVFPKAEIQSKLYPQRYRYAHSHILIDKLKEIQKNQPLDLIQIESNELLYLANHIKHIPIVYTEHDSSALFFKNSYYEMKDGTVISNFFDYLKRVRFHYSAYKKLDRIILLSQEDEQILRTFFPKNNFSFIPTGVDINHFSFVHPDRPKPKRLIYIGHYPHYPNEDAVVYFIKKIFPRIRRKIPDVEFLIVGSGITEKIKRISNQPNIRLIPDVEDVGPYLRESAVFVNSIRVSAGIKGKVLEAMATGLPVVSTKVGASGIEAKDEKEILIANTPLSFVRRVSQLFKDDKLYSEIARNARGLVEEKYDWRKLSPSLIQLYEQEINFLQPLSPQEETSVDKIIDLTNQIVEESVRQGEFCFGPAYGPEELHIELTYRCDSRCIMCDLWDFHRTTAQQERELTLDEIKQFVEESEHLKKIKTVVLSGGEPFLRKDLVEICGYFIEKFPNISLGILTNGFETENIIKKTRQILDKYKPKYLWLGSSLDGIGEVHDRIRARKGAFSRLEKTILACKREGINITLTLTLTTHNSDQLIPAKKFADSHGLELYVQFVVPKEVRERSVFNFATSQLNKIEVDLNKIMQAEIQNKSYQRILENTRDDSYQGLVAKLYYLSHLVEYQRNPKRYFRKCVAGTRFAMLSPFGDLYFCPGLKNGSIGNVREEKFDNLWTSKKAESIREFITQELCHCWLVCVVFPVIDEARRSIRQSDKKQEPWVSLQVQEKEQRRIEFPKEYGDLLQENSNLNEQEYQLGKINLESAPRGIGIGAHSRCNANCVFCLGGYPRLFDLHTYRQFFEKRLSEVLPKAEFINLCGFGELLLMPRCEEFLDYINQTLPLNNKIITTNGIPLSKSINQRLTGGRYSLQISLHASEKRLHQMLTRIENFDRIIEQIRVLLSVRKDHQSPSVNLVFIINALNIEKLPDFVEFAGKLGVDSVIANYMTVYTPAHLKLSCFFKQRVTNRMFSEAEEKAARLGLCLSLPPKFGGNGSSYPRCSDPWKYLYVETEGSILPCCYAGAHIGYLYRDEFQEVWNGQFYKSLRESLVEGKDFSWCKYCYKNKPSNVNDIRSHVSFRPDLQDKILKGISLK